MGFCLHNNAALAVSAAQIAGAKKVLIIDWVTTVTFSHVKDSRLTRNEGIPDYLYYHLAGCTSRQWHTRNI